MKKFYLIFIVASLLFISISIYGIFRPNEKYEITKGTIVRIEDEYDPIDDIYMYKTFVDYEVNGKSYKDVEYGAYNSSMKVNDEVIVYYLPDDPTFIQPKGYESVPYIVLGISVIFLISSIYLYKKKQE